ncbi:MAG: hypothetical protein QOJ13_923 [Gaiellales bacterium]|jgi:hypothetical protein|nr:hypothetical protein [Gaiellales bacterium]
MASFSGTLPHAWGIRRPFGYPLVGAALAALATLVVAPEFRSSGPAAGPAPAGTSATQPLSGLPVDFVPNMGQWGESVRFVARGPAGAAVFTSTGVRIRLGGEKPAVVQLGFEGALAGTAIVGEGQRSGAYNFFVGNDRERWRSGIHPYSSILYRGVYDGVDLRFREAGSALEYDVLVAPHADLDSVVMGTRGVTGMRLADDGSLLLATTAGRLQQAPPVAWEVLPDGTRRPIDSHFNLLGDGRYGFTVVGRDPSLPLVVDPGLDWATFLGGSGDETISGLERTTDGTGDFVLAGQTDSPDFPNTRGNLTPTGWTPYVARLRSGGNALVYATFFGGTANHSLQDVALDASNRPAVVGDTNSLDFPTTPGAYDTTPGNGSGDYDAYVTQFTADGGAMVFSTYLASDAGTAQDQGWAVGFEPDGSPVVAGITGGTTFPTTAGAFDRTAAGQDVFVSRFNPAGTALTYSTFLGGDGVDKVFGLEIDPQGFVNLTGQVWQYSTEPGQFPTTAGAFDTTFNGGGTPGIDAYVSRLKLEGGGVSDLRYSTFLGGAQYKEGGTGIGIDPNDPTSVTVSGWTYSADFPTTPGAFQRTHFMPVDASMAFVSRFRFPAGGGGSLTWSTMYGAPGGQNANDVVVDDTGAAIFAGGTGVDNPVTTEGAYDRVPGTGSFRGNADGFVARLSADGSSLLYATLLGGSYGDTIQHIELIGGSSVAVAGLTMSTDFPVTPGAFDTVMASDGKPAGGSAPGTLADDGFIARLTLDSSRGDTAAPAAPQLKWPAEGAGYTATVLGATFDWTDVSDPSGIEAYHLQISPNPTFTNTRDNVFSGWHEPWHPTSLAVKGFSVSETGTFYWRVQALDKANNLGPWSAVRTFTVSSPTPPAAPTLASPPSGQRYGPGSIVLDWNPAARGTFYELQVDTSSSFSNSNKIWVRAITATRHTVSLTTSGKRYWRVRSSNDSFTNGPWSSVRNLEIRSGSPPAPVPPPDNDPPAPGGGSAAPVAGFTPQEPNVTAGGTSQLTVNLSAPAPAGGAVLALESNYPGMANVPASVTVPAGSTSATFTVTAPANQIGGYPFISAEYRGIATAVRVTVVGDQLSRELYSTTIEGTAPTVTVIGGATLTGRVSLIPGWTANAGGALIALGSSNPALASPTTDRVTIPAGANSTTFSVTTRPVTVLTRVVILASRSMTNRITLELLPPGSLQSLSLNPSTTTGGTPVTGTVTLSSAAPAGGVVVSLLSHDTTVATVPAGVTVPAGATSATFTVTTKTPTVNEGTWSIIYASAGGITKQQTVNVNPGPPAGGPLTAPNLMFPTAGAKVNKPISFMWSEVSGAASYILQVDDSSTIAAPFVLEQSVVGNNFQTEAVPSGRVWWRARAVDAAGTLGPWSASRQLDVN